MEEDIFNINEHLVGSNITLYLSNKAVAELFVLYTTFNGIWYTIPIIHAIVPLCNGLKLYIKRSAFSYNHYVKSCAFCFRFWKTLLDGFKTLIYFLPCIMKEFSVARLDYFWSRHCAVSFRHNRQQTRLVTRKHYYKGNVRPITSFSASCTLTFKC